jgi:hypothetical protein
MNMDFATSCPLVRPSLPRIRLLFVGSRFRSTLPSDGPSRFRPCASLVLHLHQVAQGTFTPRLPDMPGTQNASRRQGGGLKAVLDRGPNAPPSGLQAATKKRPRSAEQRNITGYDAMAFAHIDGHNCVLRVRATEDTSLCRRCSGHSSLCHDGIVESLPTPSFLLSELKISGLPNRASASLRASTQNPAVRVFDRRQDRTPPGCPVDDRDQI